MSKKAITEQVVAGLILAAILYAFSYIPGFYPAIGKWLVNVWHYVTGTVPSPRWLFILSVLVVLGVVAIGLVMILVLFSARRGVAPTVPNVTDYRTDEIFGVEWVWDYRYNKIDERSFSAFCPRKDCKCRLESQINRSVHVNVNTVGYPIALFCPRCGFSQGFESDLSHLVHRVAIEIERRIRTGEFAKREQS